MPLSVGCFQTYRAVWRRKPEVKRLLWNLEMELYWTWKLTDWNANFGTVINLRYGIVRMAGSPRGCTLLLYSISQLLPAITVNPHCPPHTKPLLHYIYQLLYKRWKHMTAALRVVFPLGLEGGKGWEERVCGVVERKREGNSIWPVMHTMHFFTRLASSDTMRATYILLKIPFFYLSSPKYLNTWCWRVAQSNFHSDVWTMLSTICFC